MNELVNDLIVIAIVIILWGLSCYFFLYLPKKEIEKDPFDFDWWGF